MFHRFLTNNNLIHLVFIFSLFNTSAYALKGINKLKAKDGILNLTASNIENGSYLDGEWEFYWKQLLEPEDFKKDSQPDPIIYDFPNVWNGFDIGQSKTLNGKGYATFRLVVKTENTHDLLALKIQDCYSNYKLWLNGELFSVNGIVGTTEETSKPQWLPVVRGFYHNTDSIEIVLQVSNFSHHKGGFNQSIVIGTFENLSSRRELEVGVDLLLFGCLILIGFFFLGMFIFWRKDTSLLYFSLFCISISYRFIGTGNYIIIKIFPEFQWEIAAKFEYISLFLGVHSMGLFIREIFPTATSQLLFRILKYITIFQVTLSLLFPVEVYSKIIDIYLSILLFYLVYGGFVFIKAYKLKYEGAIFAIISILSMFIASTIAVLSHLTLLPIIPFTFGFGFLIFVFSQSFILSFRFSKSFHQIEALKEETEEQKSGIEKQNGILSKLNNEVLTQKNKIQKINEALNEKNEQVMSSIRYAQSIQSVILPKTKYIQKHFPNSFILNKPRDVVSGDFPWFLQKGDDLYIAAVDCTGHGVPGAFISLIGYFILNGIVNSTGTYEVGEILDKLNIGVTRTLQKGVADIKGDGMDIALAHINLKDMLVEFAGAHRPIYHIRASNLQVIRGDKFPIGGNYEKRKNFHTAYINIEPGDALYLFSDGLADQFGGISERKFSQRRMRSILEENNNKSMSEIEEIIIEEFEVWKGNAKQTDDILIIGLRI